MFMEDIGGGIWKALVAAPMMLVGLSLAAYANDFSGEHSYHYQRAVQMPVAVGDEPTVVAGATKGIFRNNAGDGSFLHGVAVECTQSWSNTAAWDVAEDETTATFDGVGHCVFTDWDNDQAILWWRGVWLAGTAVDYRWEWTGGTGKYQGITGSGQLEDLGYTEHVQGVESGVIKITGTWEIP